MMIAYDRPVHATLGLAGLHFRDDAEVFGRFETPAWNKDVRLPSNALPELQLYTDFVRISNSEYAD